MRPGTTIHRLFAVIHRQAQTRRLLRHAHMASVSSETRCVGRRFTMKGVFVMLAVASLCGCGGGGGGSTTAPPNQGVNTPLPVGGISVDNNLFSPGTKSVAVGATVQWAWNSCTGDAYNGQTCVCLA